MKTYLVDFTVSFRYMVEAENPEVAIQKAGDTYLYDIHSLPSEDDLCPNGTKVIEVDPETGKPV
jgi:hypothetical protein